MKISEKHRGFSKQLEPQLLQDSGRITLCPLSALPASSSPSVPTAHLLHTNRIPRQRQSSLPPQPPAADRETDGHTQSRDHSTQNIELLLQYPADLPADLPADSQHRLCFTSSASIPRPSTRPGQSSINNQQAFVFRPHHQWPSGKLGLVPFLRSAHLI